MEKVGPLGYGMADKAGFEKRDHPFIHPLSKRTDSRFDGDKNEREERKGERHGKIARLVVHQIGAVPCSCIGRVCKGASTDGAEKTPDCARHVKTPLSHCGDSDEE